MIQHLTTTSSIFQHLHLLKYHHLHFWIHQNLVFFKSSMRWVSSSPLRGGTRFGKWWMVQFWIPRTWDNLPLISHQSCGYFRCGYFRCGYWVRWEHFKTKHIRCEIYSSRGQSVGSSNWLGQWGLKYQQWEFQQNGEQLNEWTRNHQKMV